MTKPTTTSPELLTGEEVMEKFELATYEYALLRKAEKEARSRIPELSPNLHTRVPVFESVEAIDDEVVLAFGRAASIAAINDALAVQRIDEKRMKFNEYLDEIREIMARLVGKAVLISTVEDSGAITRPARRADDLRDIMLKPSTVDGVIEAGGMSINGSSSITIMGHDPSTADKRAHRHDVQPIGFVRDRPDSVSPLVTMEFKA